MQTPPISYRDATDADFPFLRELRLLTMKTLVQRHRAWIEAEQEQRLKSAMDCALIIQNERKDIGVLKVVRRDNHIELLQLQLMPEWQNLGIGSKIILDLQAEAAAAGLPLVLNTFASSRAIALFERLGFAHAASTEHFRGMRWSI